MNEIKHINNKKISATASRNSSELENIIDNLYLNVTNYIDKARINVQHSINAEMVKAYYLIGRDIVIIEQSGHERSEYGKEILKNLSNKLRAKYKNGFSVDLLERVRNFFLVYQSDEINSATASRNSAIPNLDLNLSWSHYVELIKVSRKDARKFYEIEASKGNWNVRELRRQISSFLFDRLSKAKNKQEILKLAYEGQEIIRPEDAIKDPLVIEFLGAPEPHKLSETRLEEALINNLQHFLLELGKGFAFIGRQKRITFDNDHYYADLVFYHVILKCYVILELKTTKLTHSDLGQIQLYVNYFDQEIKKQDDNPTIGLILCTSKSNSMVKYMLGDKAKQIFASTYQFHLPTEAELEAELKKEIKLLKEQTEESKS